MSALSRDDLSGLFRRVVRCALAQSPAPKAVPVYIEAREDMTWRAHVHTASFPSEEAKEAAWDLIVRLCDLTPALVEVTPKLYVHQHDLTFLEVARAVGEDYDSAREAREYWQSTRRDIRGALEGATALVRARHAVVAGMPPRNPTSSLA